MNFKPLILPLLLSSTFYSSDSFASKNSVGVCQGNFNEFNKKYNSSFEDLKDFSKKGLNAKGVDYRRVSLNLYELTRDYIFCDDKDIKSRVFNIYKKSNLARDKFLKGNEQRYSNIEMFPDIDVNSSIFDLVGILHFRLDNNCSTASIDKNYVLTAAHCVDKLDSLKGVNYISGGENYEEFDIEKIIFPKEYKSNSFTLDKFSYDYALVKLKSGNLEQIIEPSVYNGDESILTFGYPTGAGFINMFKIDCKNFGEMSDNLYVSSCNNKKGMSGGLILNSDRQFSGLISSTYGSLMFDSKIIDRINNWKKGKFSKNDFVIE